MPWVISVRKNLNWNWDLPQIQSFFVLNWYELESLQSNICIQIYCNMVIYFSILMLLHFTFYISSSSSILGMNIIHCPMWYWILTSFFERKFWTNSQIQVKERKLRMFQTTRKTLIKFHRPMSPLLRRAYSWSLIWSLGLLGGKNVIWFHSRGGPEGDYKLWWERNYDTIPKWNENSLGV